MERARLIEGLRAVVGAALVERDGACFVVDPHWGERERAQWEALAARRPADWDGREGWLCIPTGGSSGAMKLARHDEQTLGAAAAGFCAHFGVSRVNALSVLPAWHVSGLMAWARCFWTGGVFRTARWKDIETGSRPEISERAGQGKTFISLVPTQLARLLADEAATAWLRGFRAVLLGGAPSWPELRTQARAARVPMAMCYGMTETAALVAAQKPDEFLSGDESNGAILPHARLGLAEDGRLEIDADSLFRGYWPETRPAAAWRTDDLAEFDTKGRLHIRGRADALIISGGEKVNPTEVEEVLRAAGGAALRDVAVVGVPSTEWGAEVVALYPGETDYELVARLRAGLASALAPAKRPKRYLAVPGADWPRDARGKLSRAKLTELAQREHA